MKFVRLDRPSSDESPGAGATSRSGRMMLTLQKMNINRLYSQKIRQAGSGVLLCSIDSHPSIAIPWSKPKNSPAHFQYKQVLYYGGTTTADGDPAPLTLSLSLVESDAEQRKKMSTAASAFGVASATASAIPTIGGAIGASASAGEAILSVFSESLRDDVELILRAGLRSVTAHSSAAPAEGIYTIRRFARKVGPSRGCLHRPQLLDEPDVDGIPDIEIFMQLQYLSPISIDRLGQRLGLGPAGPMVSIYLGNFVIDVDKPKSRIGAEQRFVFEATFGTAPPVEIDVPYRCHSGRVQHITSIENILVFRGKLGYGVPFICEASVMMASMFSRIAKLTAAAVQVTGAGLQIAGVVKEKKKMLSAGNSVNQYGQNAVQAARGIARHCFDPSGLIAMRTGFLVPSLVNAEMPEFKAFTGDHHDSAAQILFALEREATVPADAPQPTDRVTGRLQKALTLALAGKDGSVRFDLNFELDALPPTEQSLHLA